MNHSSMIPLTGKVGIGKEDAPVVRIIISIQESVLFGTTSIDMKQYSDNITGLMQIHF